MSEQDLTRAIVQSLGRIGVWCWRNNSGTVRVGGRTIVMSPVGSPDIFGILPPNGRLFGLEVKLGNEKQRDSQVEWQNDADRNGVRYAVVRSITEALVVVRAWQAKEFEGGGI